MRGTCCMFAGHPGGNLLCLGVAAALDLAEAFCLDDVVSSVFTAGGKQDIAIQCRFACCHDLSCFEYLLFMDVSHNAVTMPRMAHS